jgi:hypothetical protein
MSRLGCQPLPRRALARRTLCALCACSLLLLALGGTPAFAGVLWRLDSNSAPTKIMPGAPARIIASAANVGDSSVLGSGAGPVRITDKLPGELQVPESVSASQIEGRLEANDGSQAVNELACAIQEPQRKEVSCETTSTTQPLAPFTQLRVTIPVEAKPGASSGEQNTVSLAGGEAAGIAVPSPPALSRPISIGSEPTAFGIERYELSPEEEDGQIDVRAGSHPFQLTTNLDLNETLAPAGQGQAELVPTAPALARNLSFELPPGLLGDPQSIPQCSDADFSSIGANDVNACPADTAIGVATVTLNLPNPPLGVFSEAVPVFNLVPAPGEPARFGLEDTKVPIILDTSVRAGGDYGVDVEIHNTTQVAQLLSSRVTLWGEPQSPAHDASRGWACIRGVEVDGESCTPPGKRSQTPFLTLPTSCLGGLSTVLHGEAWSGAQAESHFAFEDDLEEPLLGLEACSSVGFDPTISLTPVEEQEGRAPGATVNSAATPTGLNVDVSLPAEQNALGESALKETKVTLPRGMQLNPSAANGLEACSEAQIGYEGKGARSDPFAPGTEEPPRFSTAAAACPEASKVASVTIRSPDLANELKGALYIAQQEQNPFGSLFAIYLVAEDPVSGVRVKLAGEVSLNEATGQLYTSFEGTPQVPFERFALHFFEGQRASLATPALCGSYETKASFTPWADPQALIETGSAFAITEGQNAAPCPSSEPFAPQITAGSSTTQAGAFASFGLTLTHPDGDQALRSLSVHLPTGIAAMLSSITPCQEPQAAEDQCPASSEIGHSTALAGLGSEPVSLPGVAYLTGPYEGAPFGIEVSTPAIAGPFDLGVVVVRSKIEVDPHTAAVAITSDPIPTILRGVPAQIKTLNVTVDRPDFQFNPTSCEPKQISASLTGAAGTSAQSSYPFKAEGCASLPFKPEVKAQTQGQTSKANGASLTLTFKNQKGNANVAKTILTIPPTLPARLSTIQKACLAKTFEANPASCPEGSDIGQAVVHTPVLKSPLEGPIYLVSHGNAAWPDAELVLQGEGITVILDGQTAIKKGITTSSFQTVPDAPFESVEAMLPEGLHSALTTNLPTNDHYNLCGQHLTIPTTLTGQNGASLSENVKVTVQGCTAVKAAKTKKLSRKQKLEQALKACRTTHPHSRAKRTNCEQEARKRYQAHKNSHKP